jgi:hypothetical protein
MRAVEIVPYDPTWPELFDIERRLVGDVVGDVPAIERIGYVFRPLAFADDGDHLFRQGHGRKADPSPARLQRVRAAATGEPPVPRLPLGSSERRSIAEPGTTGQRKALCVN